MAVQKGRNMMLFVDGRTIALAKSFSYDLNIDTIDTTSKDSGGWNEFVTTQRGGTGSTEAFESVDITATQLLKEDLEAFLISGQPIDYIFGIPANMTTVGEMPTGGWTLPSTGKKGKLIITKVGSSYANAEVSSISADFTFTGAMEDYTGEGV